MTAPAAGTKVYIEATVVNEIGTSQAVVTLADGSPVIVPQAVLSIVQPNPVSDALASIKADTALLVASLQKNTSEAGIAGQQTATDPANKPPLGEGFTQQAPGE